MVSVLYVDDESNLLELTKLFLEFKGEFSVDTKLSAQDGLDTLKSQAYDAVVSDYQMPGMDGIEFLKIVRSKFGDLPFILFTGKGCEEVAVEAIDNGVDFYVQKGEDARLEFAKLGHKIKTAVQRKSDKAVQVNAGHRISDLINLLPDASFAIDKQGTIIAWNKAIEEMTGVAAIDILGKDNHEYARALYGEHCPVLIDAVFDSDVKIEGGYSSPVTRDGDIITAETQLVQPQGHPRVISCKATPLRDSRGNVVGAIESIRDITTRKTDEIARQENDAFLQRVEMRAHLGHWQLDLASGKMTCSAGAEAICGMNNSTMPTESIRQFALPEYRQVLDEALSALITQGKPYNLEFKIHRANDGELRDIHSIAEYDTEHQLIFGVIQDITERKQIECDLRATNEHLSATEDELKKRWQKIEEITTIFPGVVYQYGARPDGERGIHFVNERAGELIFGFDHSDMDFFRWFTGHVHPDDRNRFMESVDDSQKKAGSWNFEGRFVKPSGETVWFCGRGNPAVHGDELVYSGVLLDITERKITERTLRDSEEKFRSLAENLPESILIVDARGTILFANNAAVRTIEADDGVSIVGQNVMEFIAPEFREEAARDFAQASHEHDTGFTHYSVISAQGKKIQVESIGKAIVYEGKNADLLSIRDITERRQVEDALREGGDQLLFFNNMDEGAALHEILFDADKKALDFRVLAVNDSFEQRLGISRTAVIGKTSREAYNTTKPPYLDIFARVADTGKPEVFETYFSSLNKHFRISVCSPGKNQFATIFYEITERKQAEAALQQANHQLNLMTSITRHDILNKVSALVGYLDILRMKFPNPALAYYFSKLEDNTRAIQGLIADTQVYQDLGIHEPQWQGLEKLMKHLQVPDTIMLIVDLKGTEIYADPMLEKVFFNLLDNSIRHGQHVTQITLSSHQSDEGLTVVWEDNGVGVKTSHKEQIFKRGFGKNTGLGLFLVGEILSLTGITIKETGTEGKGARFEIMVPKGAYRLS